MFYVWLAIVILLALVEIITVNLTTIWFVISGLVALFLSFLTNNFLIQFGSFVVIGVILLLTTKKVLEQAMFQHREKTNFDRVVGMDGIVTQTITKKQMGEVKADGKLWTAFAEHKIEAGSAVEVIAIEGVKLKVIEKKEV